MCSNIIQPYRYNCLILQSFSFRSFSSMHNVFFLCNSMLNC